MVLSWVSYKKSRVCDVGFSPAVSRFLISSSEHGIFLLFINVHAQDIGASRVCVSSRSEVLILKS